MNEQNNNEIIPSAVPKGVARTRKSFSIVWLIPIVAALIGGWLAYKALSERGPTITITFQTAEGIESGKTKVKYKNVEIGLVKSIDLKRDLSGIILNVGLNKGSVPYLTEKTRFWVVRARLSANEISGIGTILSGAYIAMDPGKGGKPLRAFKGLENPPVITTGLPGSRFMLQSDKLGSMEPGSPVYFKQIKVGEVEGYKLEDNGGAVNITVFIHAPHHEFVQKNSRFWNAGGLDIAVDADGLRVNMPSIVSLLVGGIAFDTPVDHGPSDPAEPGTVFPLFDNYQASLLKVYDIKEKWVLNFEDSVRGLSPGAPVELKGIQIGQVLDINFQVDKDKQSFRIPVLIEFEPERITSHEAMPIDFDRREFINLLVARGLRAQLKIGNLLTGQLFIDLDFHPDAPDQEIIWNDQCPEFPTVQQPLEEMLTILTKTLNNINGIPFSKIGNDIRTTLKSMDEALEQTRFFMKSLDSKTEPAATATLEQATKTLAKMEKIFNSDSPINQEARRALEELAAAARSIRLLTEYLERNPNSLIFGKGK